MKFNSSLIKKVGASLLGLLILFYIVYQAFLINYDSITTETAMYAKMNDSIDVDAWFVRDEKIIDKNTSGVVSYIVDDGDKVAKGDTIAKIYYSEGDASDTRQIERLSAEISNLEKLVSIGGNYTTETKLIGTQINTQLSNLVLASNSYDIQSIDEYRNELQYLLSKKRVIIGQEDIAIYNERIVTLTEERDYLLSVTNSSTNNVTAPYSGYFVSNIDGYENYFDFDNIADIKVSDIEYIESQNITPSNDKMKISEGFVWYIVAVIDQEQRIKFENKTEVKIKLTDGSNKELPADIVSINKDEESGKYTVVLSSDHTTPEIIPRRNESIQIITQEYEGVVISENSVRFETVEKEVKNENGETVVEKHENVMGVFVKYGEKISFVQIFPSITINGYMVCKTELNEEDKKVLVTDDILEKYDEVVSKGDNLYDGKLI